MATGRANASMIDGKTPSKAPETLLTNPEVGSLECCACPSMRTADARRGRVPGHRRQPDLLVSVIENQIFRHELLAVARPDCLSLPSGLVPPKVKGMRAEVVVRRFWLDPAGRVRAAPTTHTRATTTPSPPVMTCPSSECPTRHEVREFEMQFPARHAGRHASVGALAVWAALARCAPAASFFAAIDGRGCHG